MHYNPDEHNERLRKAERVAYLIAGHLNDILTPAEQQELDDWITESDANLELFEKLTGEENIEAGLQQYLRIEREKAAAFAHVRSAIEPTRKSLVRRLWPAMAAAAVIGAVVTGYLLQRSTTIEKPVAEQTADSGEILSGGNKAVLTLSDGRTIILGTSNKGLLAEEGSVAIAQDPTGELVYSGTTKTMRYNTVATPRGGQYQINLGDGTKVWLNADSYLKFPAGMTDGERVVELRGEGFFEVAHDASRPFIVRILKGEGEQGSVEVLGTRFNVNGYGDEGVVKTTLVEGKVRIAGNGKSQVLHPGEQALLDEGIRIIQADVGEETAWVDGRFLFRDASLRSIGEQIRRWYDVEVEYRGENGQLFNLEAKRSVTLHQLLEGLEGTGQVHFKIEGRKLIISP